MAIQQVARATALSLSLLCITSRAQSTAEKPETPPPAYEKQAPLAEKNLGTFDNLDFDVFSNQKWDRMKESHGADVVVTWPDGHETKGITKHIDDMKALFAFAPDISIKTHPIRFGSGIWTSVTGVMTGTFTKPMPLPDGKTVAPTGKRAELDAGRGLDHGAWVPLRYLFPDASVPVVQISMPHTLTAETAYALGRALAPLRHEGVLLVGSGSLTHNLYEFRAHSTAEVAYAREFADWIRQVVESRDHTSLLQTMTLAPHATRAHPTIEHLVPLMFAASAGDIEATVNVLEGGITPGVLAMDSFAFGRAS